MLGIRFIFNWRWEQVSFKVSGSCFSLRKTGIKLISQLITSRVNYKGLCRMSLQFAAKHRTAKHWGPWDPCLGHESLLFVPLGNKQILMPNVDALETFLELTNCNIIGSQVKAHHGCHQMSSLPWCWCFPLWDWFGLSWWPHLLGRSQSHHFRLCAATRFQGKSGVGRAEQVPPAPVVVWAPL